MTIVWFLGGIVLVSLTYVLFGDPVDPWPGVRSAEVAGLAYLLVILWYATRPPFPRRARIFVAVATLAFGASTAFISASMEETTTWQKEQLMRIQAVIHRNVLAIEMPVPLMAAYERYVAQRPGRKKSVSQLFKDVIPDAAEGSVVLRPMGPQDSLLVYVESMTEDEVILVGSPSWGKGWREDFRNYDGKQGLPQVRAMLTGKGVAYESQN